MHRELLIRPQAHVDHHGRMRTVQELHGVDVNRRAILAHVANAICLKSRYYDFGTMLVPLPHRNA
jgi:hypothetical protein